MEPQQSIIFGNDGERRQKNLAQMYKSRQRPLCPCRSPGVEMYIAKLKELYIVKRMPNTGALHAPECDSFEPPPELSGLGEVLGSAIQENEDGLTELKFDFSLAKIAGRAMPEQSGEEPDSVRTDGKKLTLRSTLHFLWEGAGFNKWTPAMAGKRSWTVVRKHLLQAAENSQVKGASLVDRLYLPESFRPDQKDAIAHRRRQLLAKMTPGHGRSRNLGILIGEVKDLQTARFGQKLIVKHAPGFDFMLAEDIYERLQKRYADELELWGAFEETTHLITIATFGVSAAGVASVEEMALMPVSANWIPYENVHDKELVEKLATANRRFIKGLRYNLAASKPLASVVLSDTAPLPTAMYVLPLDADDDYHAALDALKAESLLASWTWDMSNFATPDFPPAG